MLQGPSPILVIGALNIDILGVGVPSIVGPGELSFGGDIRFAAGGKARNIAQMIAMHPHAQVKILGKTGNDPYGLWQIPIKALKKSGVDTSFVLRDESHAPGIALIPVDVRGNNQIYVLPGANDYFLPDDIIRSAKMFEDIAVQKGFVILSLEIPLSTALTVIETAKKMDIKLLVDPGGMKKNANYNPLLQTGIFLLKPNIHEASYLSGISIINENSVREAARIIHEKGVENVLITLGEKGAYLIGNDVELQIPIPPPSLSPELQTDETGCGDQVMAVCALLLSQGKTLEASARAGIVAGSLQFAKIGVQPLSYTELKASIDID